MAATLTMTVDLLEKLNDARTRENPIRWMKGYKLADGRGVEQYEVTFVDILVDTAEVIVYSERDGVIKLEILTAKDLLYRTQ